MIAQIDITTDHIDILFAQLAIAFKQFGFLIKPRIHDGETAGEKRKQLVPHRQIRRRNLLHDRHFVCEPFFGNRLQQCLFALKKAIEV